MKKTKEICITAMGIALFVVLSLCLQVPVFENYYLCLGYVVLALFCYSFGIGKGMLVGSLGVVLYCMIINGLRGMPGWAIGNLVIALILGITCKITAKISNTVVRYVIICISIVFATAIAMLGIKSIIECFLYSQPFLVRVASNMYAFVADVVVLIVSIPICFKLHPFIEKNLLNKQ